MAIVDAQFKDAVPLTDFEAQQNEEEFAEFMQLLQKASCKRYLEIGSRFGGSLARACWWLGIDAHYVAVDKPHDDGGRSRLMSTVNKLQSGGFDITLVIGDSTEQRVIDAVRAKGPFDAVFIDACHLEAYVRQDFKNYGALAPIVAFHDIGFFRSEPRPGKLPIDVPKVWAELKQQYRHVEFRREQTDNGIGVIFHD